jgi:hypothetical protein
VQDLNDRFTDPSGHGARAGRAHEARTEAAPS